MSDQLSISPKPRRHRGNGNYMAYPLEVMHGTIFDRDHKTRQGSTVVVRFHNYGYNVDKAGRKGHQLFYYHHHQGAWSDGATRNRTIMAMAAAQARLEIKDDTLGPQWKTQFEEYTQAKSKHPKQPRYTSLYTYVYRLTYDRIKNQLEADFIAHQRTNLVNSFADTFYTKRVRELETIREYKITGPEIERQARAQTDTYIASLLTSPTTPNP